MEDVPNYQYFMFFTIEEEKILKNYSLDNELLSYRILGNKKKPSLIKKIILGSLLTCAILYGAK